MKRITLVFVLAAGCAGQIDSSDQTAARGVVVPPTRDYCAPWDGAVFRTCVVLPSVPAGTFGAGERVACRTVDGTVWSTMPPGGWIRYESIGDLGTPGAWALSRALCEVAPDGRVFVRSSRSGSGPNGSGE